MTKTSSLKHNKTLLVLLLLTLVGLALRIANCYWGYPYPLHPDEPTIVENAIDMIRRHSWEANVYNRPDHFEIKCCAGLFQIVSFFKFHVSADIAFPRHTMVFYLVARGYTAIFGTLMIPLCYMILEKLKKGSGLIGAAIVTFLSVLLEHSATATPDIVLTFIVMLEAYISLLYLEKPNKHKILIMSVIAGLGITVKYTCAICCLYIAFLVIYDAIRHKDYLQILTLGLIAICIVLATSFIMAPNLFTHMDSTILTLKKEARSTHLGSDGFGFFGNIFYYLKMFLSYIGAESAMFELLGIIYIVRFRRQAHLCFLLGLLFWICTSVLALHWNRWGLPFYIFYIFLTALGISYAFDCLRVIFQKRILFFKPCCILLDLFLFLFWSNLLLSGARQTLYTLTTDTRLPAIEYCKKYEITPKNSLADGYTPYMINDPLMIPVTLDANEHISLTDDQTNVRYFILSENMYGRYYAEPERYSSQIKVYEAIQNQCELLKEFPVKKYNHSPFLIPGIVKYLSYIYDHNENTLSGFTILIYKYTN